MSKYGLIMRPCSLTEEANEKVMRSTKYFTESDFRKKYSEYAVAMDLTAEAAKIYILKNYQKINDWSDLDVTIRDNKSEIHYYKFKGAEGWNEEIDFVKKMLKERKKKQKPITSLKDVVLDTTDGDFSLTINDKDHLWIDNESIIEIAHFIESVLNSANTDDKQNK